MGDNPTHGRFEDITDNLEPELRSICIKLRELISTCHRSFVEIAWTHQGIASYGVGPRKMSEHYAYICPQKNYVNLGFYHGVSLRDANSLLEGTGKRLRHIKIKNISEVDHPDIKKLLVEAIDDRRGKVRET